MKQQPTDNYKTNEATYLADYMASKNQRFSNLMLDLLFAFLFQGAVLALLEGIGILDENMMNSRRVIVPLSFLLVFLYWTGTEYLFGKTPGKSITKTKVVMMDGSKPDLLTVVKRTLARLIPFDPFSFLFGAPTGWHDSLTNTRVVEDDFTPEDDFML
ncbi:RDD family protein [Flavilitoribacter nigricans]|uniref:RDD family protein n=1 Tax=Flavilitoribacter nigricans (strain ATCC 23147 / DSM 23189 / NBRC 102662 / NCIMB 1420 / SS-2) TaxID=1122177 RepID=A0A2D0ND42_FLAN2|nr:RDD family protein [Flavilitoribacter nigricans]PHN06434.1 RDD family protein [Flavilitoribacter nigricans DSM 23189 = NBRC 102662]